MAEIQRLAIKPAPAMGLVVTEHECGAYVSYPDHLADKAAALKAKDEEIATLREQMHCACKEDENGAIASLCMAHRVAFTANQYADNCDEVERLREVQGELVEAARLSQELLSDIKLFRAVPSDESIDKANAKTAAAIERAEGKA